MRGRALVATACLLYGAVGEAKVPELRLEKSATGYALLRDGVPYVIRGAGGEGKLQQLAAAGGNSVRTWGTEQTETILPQVRELGLTIAAGLWVEHERHGFDYDDAEAVAEQVARHKASIDRVKAHPEILMWLIGNEVWLEAENMGVWRAIEEIAAHAKAVDPGRPTMTVLPHVSQTEVEAILKYCPSIDILGINSYGGLHVVMDEARSYGWNGPMVIAEWGVNGPWEMESTDWGAEIEPTSTAKAEVIRKRLELMEADPDCIGSYVFLWGYKQEATPTWFSLFLKDSSALGAVDVLHEAWTGKPPQVKAPQIRRFTINGQEAEASVKLKPGETAEARVRVSGSLKDLSLEWVCHEESQDRRLGGDKETVPPRVDIHARVGSGGRLHFTAPEKPGAYRLFLYLRNSHGRAATANLPFLVTSVCVDD